MAASISLDPLTSNNAIHCDSLILTLASGRTILYGNVAFSIVLQFFQKGLRFLKNLFQS